uniref:Uncharacterized protein n=1 Tax=Kalanchoe fedtschenkoi TaxID=63787 RepID=A0A7N1A4D2_KALFE
MVSAWETRLPVQRASGRSPCAARKKFDFPVHQSGLLQFKPLLLDAEPWVHSFK